MATSTTKGSDTFTVSDYSLFGGEYFTAPVDKKLLARSIFVFIDILTNFGNESGVLDNGVTTKYFLNQRENFTPTDKLSINSITLNESDNIPPILDKIKTLTDLGVFTETLIFIDTHFPEVIAYFTGNLSLEDFTAYYTAYTFEDILSIIDKLFEEFKVVFADNIFITDSKRVFGVYMTREESLEFRDKLLPFYSSLIETDSMELKDIYNRYSTLNAFSSLTFLDFTNTTVMFFLYDRFILSSAFSKGMGYNRAVEFVQNIFKTQTNLQSIVLYDIKNLDVKRTGSSAIIWIEDFTENYIGFGNESWGDYIVTADCYLYGNYTNKDLEKLVAQIHTYVGTYQPSRDEISNDYVAWVKLTDEVNHQEEARGITRYTFSFEIRVYVFENR